MVYPTFSRVPRYFFRALLLIPRSENAHPNLYLKHNNVIDLILLFAFSDSFLTSEPHVAGRPQQYVLAEWVRDKFNEYGFDSSEIVTYNVLLSYPSEVDGEESVVCIYEA